MTRLLVMRSGALGDFVLTLPVLAALRARWPAAQVTVVGHPERARLAADAGLADEVLDADDPMWSALFVDRGRAAAKLEQVLAGLDGVVCYTADPEGLVERGLRGLCAGWAIVHPALPTGRHASAHLLAALSAVGIEAAECTPALRLSQRTRARGEELLRGTDGRPIVAVHPGSGSESKCWPWERFEAVARALVAERGCRVVFTVGPADEHLLPALESLALPQATVLRGLDVVELAGALSHAACYVGNDSGVTHLAAALGVPTIAIFGPTDPAVWAPLGERVTVLQGLCPDGPCAREHRPRCPRRECLLDIDEAQVLAAVEAMVA